MRLQKMLVPILIMISAFGIIDKVFGHERRINTWLINGSYPDVNFEGFNKDFIGTEETVSPSSEVSSGGKPWLFMDDRLYCRNQDDYVDLSTYFLPKRKDAPTGGNENVIAYAHTYVWSPADQNCQLLIGSSDALKAWFNGKLVVTLEPAERQPVRDEYKYPINLKAGWNRLLIKSANAYRIWGFYAKVADTNNSVMNGLEYSVDTPQGQLAVTTNEMPNGYTGWPYIWLTVRGIKPMHSVPSASPFRLMAKGGTPPYTWSVREGNLPPGLSLDSQEGEILGTCEETVGKYPFVIEIKDAEGNIASNSVCIEVLERPTKWYEDGKIGGLIHGSQYNPKYSHGDPNWQAQAMAKEGYCWGAPTTGYYPGSKNWPGWYKPAFIGNNKFTEFTFIKDDNYKRAFEANGVGFGSYLGLPDAKTILYEKWQDEKEYRHWARFNDYLQQYFEEWFDYAHPVVIYLDGAGFAAPIRNYDTYDPRNKGYDFDALYSMGKTVWPKTLIIANSCGNPGLDWRLGDCDVFSTEGMNDGYNPVWDRWPIGNSEFYPKKIPNESWRYPFKHEKWGNYLDSWYWQEWARSVVSMICEGYLCNFDHSISEGHEQFHEKIGNWISPRLGTLKGTQPGPVYGATWGYSVQKKGKIYLHILYNPRGKIGLPSGATELLVKPLDKKITSAKLVPDRKPLGYTQKDKELIVDVSGVNFDPVDTVIELEIEGAI